MKTPDEIGKIVSDAYREALSNYHNFNDFEQEEWDLIKSAEKEVASLIAAERAKLAAAVEALNLCDAHLGNILSDRDPRSWLQAVKQALKKIDGKEP